MTTRARYGLAVIAKAELQQGDLVLLPAYHCRSLVEPFLWAGCRIRFYTMNKDLSPNLDAFESQLKAARAVVLVRYFGFDGNIKNLAKRAREQDCLVIEDLAHAPFIGELHGDFGVTSLPKFFPVTSGAEIWIAQSRDSDALAQILSSHRQNPVVWQLDSILARLRRGLFARKPADTEEFGAFHYFQEAGLRESVPRGTLAEIARHDESVVIEARRRNYRLLSGLFKNSSIGCPLYPGLKRGEAPYVYPYILEDTHTFGRLRNAGIPLFRWEELAPSACEISAAYRSKLIQIPCHQDLSARDLSRIEATAQALDKRR